MKLTIDVKEKAFVALDEDGHFRIMLLSDRPKIYDFLKTASSGDYWANELEEILDLVGLEYEEHVLVAVEDKWEEFVELWCRRGVFEIVDL